MQYPLKGPGNVNIGGRFFVVNAAMSQISAHPLVWAQSKVQRPWALFRETTVPDFLLNICHILSTSTCRSFPMYMSVKWAWMAVQGLSKV